jgi:hypothetical protein
MTDRPILFSAEMVRAILYGRKTQTRRAIKPQPTILAKGYEDIDQLGTAKDRIGPLLFCPKPCKYGAFGDALWVRETFCAHWGAPPHGAPQSYRIVTGDELPPIEQQNGDFYQPVPSDIMTIWYEAEGNKPFHMKWKPSIHMPQWASRITLRITDIRVERLQDISEEDAIAEGVALERYVPVSDSAGKHSSGEAEPTDPVEEYRDLWNKINGPGAWEANPWVWVISFERVKP